MILFPVTVFIRLYATAYKVIFSFHRGWLTTRLTFFYFFFSWVRFFD